MGLTYDDLQQIRKIVEETIKPLEGSIEALTNDIKEMYGMIADIQGRLKVLERNLLPNEKFEKLSLEQKILKLNSELIIAAKQAGVSLPR